MNHNCPCCGHELTESVKVKTLTSLPGLSPPQRKIVEALARAYPNGVPVNVLVGILYADDPSGGPLNANIVTSTRVRNTRAKLEPVGWSIPTAQFGRGNAGEYRLVRTS